MQRINRIFDFLIILFMLISLFFIEKNDKLYHCVAVGVENDSISFFIAIPDANNNITVSRYIVSGNDYSNALLKAKNEGVKIDTTVLRCICYSEYLTNNNKTKFNDFAKEIFNISAFVYVCNMDILTEKDCLNNEGVFALNDLFGKNNGGVIFLDVLYGLRTPPKIIYQNSYFIRDDYE